MFLLRSGFFGGAVLLDIDNGPNLVGVSVVGVKSEQLPNAMHACNGVLESRFEKGRPVRLRLDYKVGR